MSIAGYRSTPLIPAVNAGCLFTGPFRQINERQAPTAKACAFPARPIRVTLCRFTAWPTQGGSPGMLRPFGPTAREPYLKGSPGQLTNTRL